MNKEPIRFLPLNGAAQRLRNAGSAREWIIDGLAIFILAAVIIAAYLAL